MFSFCELMHADHNALKRFAAFLNLKYNIDSMSKRQLVRLIKWRVSRAKKHALGTSTPAQYGYVW